MVPRRQARPQPALPRARPGVLADAQPLQHAPAKAHQKFFWQWFCLGWENWPADSAAASILRRQHGAFSAQPPGTELAVQETSRDGGKQTSIFLLACSESWPPRSGACCPLPGMAGAVPRSHSASLGHRWSMLLAFANEIEEESWGLQESTASEGSCPPPGR